MSEGKTSGRPGDAQTPRDPQEPAITKGLESPEQTVDKVGSHTAAQNSKGDSITSHSGNPILTSDLDLQDWGRLRTAYMAHAFHSHAFQGFHSHCQYLIRS